MTEFDASEVQTDVRVWALTSDGELREELSERQPLPNQTELGIGGLAVVQRVRHPKLFMGLEGLAAGITITAGFGVSKLVFGRH